jgi:formylglycine-generating enzyme required for sulfatase activity
VLTPAALPKDGRSRRAMATRMALDEALDRWWTDGGLPPLGLLRDGLLLLEGGHPLDEAQSSFLLRVALRHQRGMITALRHQTDPDRTAFLIKEALLDQKQPLPPKLLRELQREDEKSAIWLDYLIHDLAYEVGVAQGKRRELATRALAQIRPDAQAWSATAYAVTTPPQTTPLSYRWGLRWLLWALLLLIAVISFGVRSRSYDQSVRIPAGSYIISDPLGEGRTRLVVVVNYRIDVTEVTNGAYARCVTNGSCAAPNSSASATRADYYTNPAYAEFPVVNVTWDNANAYCIWLGKELPTIEEWEVAASIAPLTQRTFLYPWGDRFDPRFVNGGSAEDRDTLAVGSFHPVGNSSFGLRDMAGNVAEWTASSAAELFDGFVVKGGSYRDSADALRLAVQQSFGRTTAEPWLGFRCVSK